MPRSHFTEDSKEKAKVREKLWLPVFDKVIKKKSIKNLRYLCFPGKRCHFVRHLVDTNRLLVRNCIAVEMNPWIADEIRKEFAKIGGITEPKEVYQGRLEKLVNEDDIFKHFFPFDIIEFDFESPAYPPRNHDRSMIMDAVETCLELQTQRSEFYLISTFKLYEELTTPQGTTRANVLIRNILRPNAHFLNSQILHRFISNHNRRSNFNNWCALYAIPLDIVESAPRRYKARMFGQPYTYIGESAGYSTRMVSFALHFKKCENPRRIPYFYINMRNKNKEKMITAVNHTKWVRWNGRQIVYDNITDAD